MSKERGAATPILEVMSRKSSGVDDEILGRAYDRRLMARIWVHARPYRRRLAASTLLFPALAAVDLVQPYLVKVAIDQHILRGDWPGLTRLGTLFLAILLTQYVLRYLQVYVLSWTGQHVVHDLRQALFAHVQRLPARFFDQNPVGRLMTRILSDVEAVGELFASGVVAIFADILTLAGIVVVMLALDWHLALMTFAVLPGLFGVVVYFRSRARDAYREVRNRLARLNTYLQESLLGMAVVQLFGRERTQAAEFARLNEEHRRATFRRMGYDAFLYAGVEVVGAVAVAALIWWGGAQILAGTLTFGVLVAFIEYVHRFFLPIRDVSAKYTVMQSAMVGAERIFGLLDTPASLASPPRAYRPGAEGGRPGARPPAAIEFRDVWFRYGNEPLAARTASADADGGGWVLSRLSFRIERGERIAVVGATGAGKTTLARLMTRTYDVQRGAVLVDGVDVREWDLSALRRHVGLVLQDVVIFSGRVDENLAVGGIGGGRGASEVDRATIEEAARRAHADRFIRSLPGGYASVIRERGANLSHGQRQLLSVARALVYNPPVLVLDEATSSVDPETERLLQDAVDELLTGRTSIVIAHRLSTIQRADRILVLRRGELREDGPHAALLAQGGLYASLYQLQFGREASAIGPSVGSGRAVMP